MGGIDVVIPCGHLLILGGFPYLLWVGMGRSVFGLFVLVHFTWCPFILLTIRSLNV